MVKIQAPKRFMIHNKWLLLTRSFRIWTVIKYKKLSRLWEPNSNDYVKFAILCTPRTGSTWLHTLLNSHPQIHSLGEVIYEGQSNRPTLEEIYRPQPKSILAVGFKLFYGITHEGYQKLTQDVLEDPTIRLIHLIRRDIGAQLKSYRIAEKGKVWSQTGKTTQETHQAISEKELAQFSQNLQLARKRIKEEVSSHSQAYLPIAYEDLVEQQEATTRKIMAFLEVRRRTLYSLLTRQSGS